MEVAGELSAALAAQAATVAAQAGASAGATCRVGIDVVAVSEVADSLRWFGDRYACRLYTAAEREDAGWPAAGLPAAEGLAARFAAKEAAVKVLAPDGWVPPWTDIEVRRLPGGRCVLRVSGRAAALARAERVRSWAVSLTHHAGVAAAVVAAVCDAPPRAGACGAAVAGDASVGGGGGRRAGWSDEDRREWDG